MWRGHSCPRGQAKPLPRTANPPPKQNPRRKPYRWKTQKAPRQNQPQSGERTQPTAQAVGQNQKTIQLRRSERNPAKATKIRNPRTTRRNTSVSSRPRPQSPTRYRETGAPSSTSPASACQTTNPHPENRS